MRVLKLVCAWTFEHHVLPIVSDLREQQVFNQAAAAAGNLPPGSTFFMENFTYANSVVMARLFEHLSTASFSGVTVCGGGGSWGVVVYVQPFM